MNLRLPPRDSVPGNGDDAREDCYKGERGRTSRKASFSLTVRGSKVGVYRREWRKER